ncbi:putative odorant receptor 92a [Wyeomyia smithii]|uniref:putative odorant receptor 92a n=1 Tax=Wyeomyia smithii TaxID=174621 RepID=UPI002467CAD2|nr:putative odorant receptor 92a [Wyeomyia smithii]
MERFKLHFAKIKRIFKEQEYPDMICIQFSLNILTFLGQWRHQQQTRRYRVYFYLVNVGMFLHACTLLWDWMDIYNDLIALGDNLCVSSGVVLVLYKKWYHNYYSSEFEQIFEKFKLFNKQNNERDKTVRDLTRKYFIEEYVLIVITVFLGWSLIIAICGHSLFDSTMPIRAKFPMEMDSAGHSAIIFCFQLWMSTFIIQAIVFIDGIGGQVMSQMTLHYHVLFRDFKAIGTDECDSAQLERDAQKLIKRHQELLDFGQKVNALYQPMLMAQLGCSLSMICLTAFEATITTDELFIFLRFTVYAISVFIQLLYWCYYGNRVTHMSSTINEALVNCNWMEGNSSFKKDLMIVMMRAQKPFEFRVYGYFPISYETFLSVLSRSYSFFTLFRTVSK